MFSFIIDDLLRCCLMLLLIMSTTELSALAGRIYSKLRRDCVDGVMMCASSPACDIGSGHQSIMLGILDEMGKERTILSFLAEKTFRNVARPNKEPKCEACWRLRGTSTVYRVVPSTTSRRSSGAFILQTLKDHNGETGENPNLESLTAFAFGDVGEVDWVNL